MIEGHGDDIYRYRDKIRSNFSSNIFSHADLSGLKAHLKKRLDGIGNYPEPEPYTLEQMLAERLGLSPRQIKADFSTIYVIDQSYANYTLASLPLPHEMVQMPNCLLLHSMTKRYCIPGLRLGYVTAVESLIEQLRHFRQPWSVNALAIEAGCYL